MKKEKDEYGQLTKICPHVKHTVVRVGSIACQNCINNLSKVTTNEAWVNTKYFWCMKEKTVNDFIYECPSCGSTNLTFDVSGAVYNPIYHRFEAYVGQESEAECLDCGSTRFTAIKEEVND